MRAPRPRFSAVILTLVLMVVPARAEDVVLVSADAEWKALLASRPGVHTAATPFGQSFHEAGLVFLHGGWGKIAAAGSTQYAVDRWHPSLLVNIGTCGGFKGVVEKGQVLLVEETVVYDIVEQMGDPAEAIRDYTTRLDLAWVGSDLPPGVRRGRLVSGDRDVIAAEVPKLRDAYGGLAGDWESGAIAWIARRNRTPALILRAVSDVVDETAGDETYGHPEVFEASVRGAMKSLSDQLPFWIQRFHRSRRR
jgi:adenosylhomocysteine nucleosidase